MEERTPAARIEETLRAMLVDPSPAVREAASSALDRLRARCAAAGYLVKLKSGRVEERVRVVFAAEEIAGPEGMSLLLAALDDPDREVRGAAVRALEAFPTPAVLKALVARLPAEEGVVLGNLLEALGKSRRRELASIVERYLEHPDPEIRGKALVAYARVGDEGAWEKILPHASSKDEQVRAAAGRALGER